MRVIECPKCKANLDKVSTVETQVICSYCRATIDLSEFKRDNDVQNVQLNFRNNVDINVLLEKGGVLLEEGQWEKAERQFNRVITSDPKNAQAYLGLLLAERKVAKLDGLALSGQFSHSPHYNLVLRFADDELKKRLEEYNEIVQKIEHKTLWGTWHFYHFILGILGGIFWADIWFLLFSSWTDDPQLITFNFLDWPNNSYVGVPTYIGLIFAYIFGVLLVWSFTARREERRLKSLHIEKSNFEESSQ